MRRIILLVAVVMVMAMIIAGPAHAGTSIGSSVGGGSISVGNSSSSGISNIGSVILTGVSVGDVTLSPSSIDID